MARRFLVIAFVMACGDREKPAPPPPPPPPVVADAAPSDATVDSAIDAAPPDAFVAVWRTAESDAIEKALSTERNLAKALAALDDAQLRTLHGAFSCRLAFDAASLLAERGDSSLLPVRAGENDPERLARKLCMISTIYEEEKLRPYLVEYVAPTFRTSYEECLDDLPEGTTDTHVKTKHTRAALTGKELRQFLLADSGPACVAGSVKGEWVCSGAGPGQNVDVTLAPVAGGKLYITKIDGTRNGGCY